MAKHQKALTPCRSATRQYLFHKAEASPDSEASDTRFKSGRDGLAPEAGRMLTGEDFFGTAMNHLAACEKFGAMVIRIDNFKPGIDDSEEKDRQEIMAHAIKTIDTICREESGVWGRIEADAFGCFFPDNHVNSCLKISEKIQRDFEGHRGETATIGIAVYPTKNFNKGQILTNARKALDHATFFGPKSTVCFDAVSLNISGDTRYQAGDIKGAIEEFQSALTLDPSNVNLHNSLGVCYGETNDLTRAIEEFETVIWLDPKEVMAMYNIGIAHLFLGDKQKALEYFLEASHFGKEVFELPFQTGRLYMEMGEPEKAKRFFQEAVELRPDSWAAYHFLAECLEAEGETNAAVQAYRKAVTLNPNDAESLSALGYLLYIKGEDLEIATVFCQKSVELSPETPKFRNRLGQLYLKCNRLDEASKEFRESERLGGDITVYLEEIRKLENDALGN